MLELVVPRSLGCLTLALSKGGLGWGLCVCVRGVIWKDTSDISQGISHLEITPCQVTGAAGGRWEGGGGSHMRLGRRCEILTVPRRLGGKGTDHPMIQSTPCTLRGYCTWLPLIILFLLSNFWITLWLRVFFFFFLFFFSSPFNFNPIIVKTLTQ